MAQRKATTVPRSATMVSTGKTTIFRNEPKVLLGIKDCHSLFFCQDVTNKVCSFDNAERALERLEICKLALGPQHHQLTVTSVQGRSCPHLKLAHRTVSLYGLLSVRKQHQSSMCWALLFHHFALVPERLRLLTDSDILLACWGYKPLLVTGSYLIFFHFCYIFSLICFYLSFT